MANEAAVVELGSSAADPHPLGTTIGGRYVLRRVLGRGAASVVFAAEHVLVQRPVALKIPLTAPELHPIFCARLRRETALLARVRHPAIVDVIDAGEHEGSPFLAMELLEGRTLSGLIAARGRLEPDEAIKVGIVLAEGLAAVHAAGMVHRDVKPSNVLVTPAVYEQLHLCDFGVAKGIGPTDKQEAKLTHSGAILGTPEYMPMEALFASEEADHRVDIYALGVTLFECLTGAVPVEGTLAQILMRLTQSTLPSVYQLRPEVPAALSALIARCLERDPKARFASMTELAEALRAIATRANEDVDLLRIAKPRVSASPAAAAAAPQPAAQPAAQDSVEARRGHRRAPYGTLATLQSEGAPPSSARIEDISEGGVLLIADVPYKAGDEVRLRFGLPISGRLIVVPAVVRWVKQGRGSPATGVEFKLLPDDARVEIKRYIMLMAR